jgi:peptide/nickel transport system substrate-binding protein
VRSIRAVGPKTVRVVLAEPFAEWQGLFGSVLPAHALRGQDLTEIWRNGIDDPRTGKAIGSGPFLVERWERGRQVVLRRNPNYWGPHPAHIDRVVVRFALSPEAAAEQFRSGALDLATHFAPTTAVALAQERGVRLLSNQTGAGWDHLEFRVREGGHPALRSKLVRRAIAYGVDRAAIVEQVVSKAAVNARQRDSAIFPRQDPRYEPSWARYTRRPALARRLLVRAGCTLGADGVRACDGRRLSLRLATTVIAGGFRPDVVQLIQRQLGPLGVEILPEFYPSVAIFGPLFRRGQFDIVLFAWVGTPDRAFGAKLIFGCGGADNVTGYCQRIVTDDLDRALGALDPGKQARVLNRVDKRLASDVPVLPLYQQTQTMVVRATVRGFGSALNMQLSPLWNAEDWWLAPSR